MTNLIRTFSDLTINQLEKLIEILGGPANVPSILSGELRATLKINHILECSTPLDPATFIAPKWVPWRGPLDGKGLVGEIENDPRSSALTEIDWEQVTFIDCLEGVEKAISGDEKFRRLKKAGHIRFGGNVLLSLLNNYRAQGTHSILEWLYREKGITCLDFFGDVFRSPEAPEHAPSVLYLYRDDGEWRWSPAASLNGNYPWETHNKTAILIKEGY